MNLPAKLRIVHPIYRDYSDDELEIVIASLDPEQVQLLNDAVVSLHATADGLPVPAYTDLEVKRRTLPIDKQAAKDKLDNEIAALQNEAQQTVITELAWTDQYLIEMRKFSEAIAEQKKKIRDLKDPIDIQEAKRHLKVLEAQYAQRAKSAEAQASGPRPGQKA